MKLIEANTDCRNKTTKDMAVGQVAKVLNTGLYSGHVVLRTYDRFVNLTSPNNSWSIDPRFVVEIFPAGTILRFEV